MDKAAKTWLASAIDGEGCISLNLKAKRVQLVVYNTHEGYAKKAKELIPYSGMTVLHYHCKTPPTERVIYSVHLADKLGVLTVLLQVYPFLVVKREKAWKAISFIVKHFGLEVLSRETLDWISKYRQFS